MILYVIFWSDDFEGTMLRKNYNSAWIKTIQIGPPQDQITSYKYIYVVAFGRKGDDYDNINLIHNNELQQLSQSTYRYFGASHARQNIPVVVETMTILVNRLERCIINNILIHAGLSTKRWGYVA